MAALNLVLGAPCRPDDALPLGFKPDRYQKLWERNPFTLVTPVAAQAQPTVFDKLVLLSWLNEGGTDVVFIQNTETNSVQKVTNQPNADGLKLVTVHVNPDPHKVEVVLAHGTEQGTVKFRVENQGGPQVAGPPGQPMPQNAGSPGAPQPLPGASGRFQVQVQPNSLEAFQQGNRAGVVPPRQGTTSGQAETTYRPPRASEIRRKRLTAPPVKEQLVNPQQTNQDPANQPQAQ